jgi:PAS domain S-box-containing protein
LVHDVDSLYPMILDSITEGVFTVDEQWRITSFNSEAERIIGIPREQAIGRRCHQVFRANICESRCALRETIRTGEPQRNIRIEALDAQMEPVPLIVNTAVLKDREGNLLGGIEIFRDVTDLEALRRELDDKHVFADIVGASAPMLELFRILPDIAESESPVLIQGPSGTGKELIAQAIHTLSPRREGPYVRVNCGALPDTLLESEMFGHVKGAFTGASRDRLGRFREAHGGTLLLDEVAELSPAFQVKLLRVLEDGHVQPLGGTGSIRVNVRVLSATNRDLRQRIDSGAFREDLYYRLGVVPLSIPPLAERRKDIPELVAHILRKLALRAGKEAPGITPDAMQALYDYDYPGNVRELENILERAFILGHGESIDLSHLPAETQGTRGAGRKRSAGRGPELAGDVHTHPQALAVLHALREHRWNRTEAAKALGIARNTLWRWMKKYDIQ